MIYNAIGFGEMSGWEGRQLNRGLGEQNVRAISLRDGGFEALGRNISVTARPDPAFLAPLVYSASSTLDVIGLGVIDRGSEFNAALFSLYRDLTQSLAKRGREWQFFTNGHEADHVVAKEFSRRIGGRAAEAATRPRSAQELVTLVTSYQSIVSCRLHSLILAASFRVPAVGVSWDPKVDAFLAMIGVPERCVAVKDRYDEVLAKLVKSEVEGYDDDLLDDLALRSWNGLVLDADDALGADSARLPPPLLEVRNAASDAEKMGDSSDGASGCRSVTVGIHRIGHLRVAVRRGQQL